MGLDMYAWTVDPADLDDQDVTRQVDVTLPKQNVNELWYWRKHHDLHGWMESLYRQKGGAAESFNCVTVRLTYADLTRLEIAIKGNELPATTGLFFGNNPPDEESNEQDMKFISAAKQAIEDGKAVFYDSWW
jgi:hypothetical protein